MKARTTVPFVDTNLIPDRNGGIGSLLWDLQNPRDPVGEGPPLLETEFAFLDVGVSRAQVATALKSRLAGDLAMEVEYVATERPDAVPYANVTLLGDRAERIRGHLSGMTASKGSAREVTAWHYVVDRTGKVSSVAYAYEHYGNEVWESYFMGRTFMFSGENVDYRDPTLDEMLASDVTVIEARVGLERQRDGDPSRPGPSWDGYRMDRSPLEAGLAAFGITLQRAEVPQRVKDKQNVLFLGNVLNHHPHHEQVRELDRITANLEQGDVVIVQTDELETPSIEVLRVKTQRGQKTRERVRWIDTKELEVRMPVGGAGSWRQVRVKPAVDRMVLRLVECLDRRVTFPAWGQKSHRVLVHRRVSHVFRTFFRALPVDVTLRVAIREAVRRVPREGGPKGMRVFEGDATDAYGGALGSDPRPLVSEAELLHFGQDIGRPPANEGLGVELPESRSSASGWSARHRSEPDLPTLEATGPLGGMSALPPQVELSGLESGLRFRGDPEGASKLDGAGFTPEASEEQGQDRTPETRDKRR